MLANFRVTPGCSPLAHGLPGNQGTPRRTFLMNNEQSRRLGLLPFEPQGNLHFSSSGRKDRNALIRALEASGEVTVAREVGRCCSMPLRQEHATLHGDPDGHRHLTGMNYCGRMTCLECGPFRRSVIAKRLQANVPTVAAQARLIHVFITLSIQHDRATGWKAQVEVLRAMLNSLAGRAPWRRNVRGLIRMLESTFGKSGHHPHVHLLVSLEVVEGWEEAPFRAWVQQVCQEVAGRFSATCAFSGKWWQRVPPSDLPKVIAYMFKAPDWQASLDRGWARRTSIGEGRGRGWSGVATAYADVWRDSRSVRWHGTSGWWKGPKKAQGPAEGTEARGTPQDVHEAPPDAALLHFSMAIWRTWPKWVQRDRHRLLCDPARSWAKVVSLAMEWGAHLGAPRGAPHEI